MAWMVAVDTIVLKRLIRSRLTLTVSTHHRELFGHIPRVLVLKLNFSLHLPLLNAAVPFRAHVPFNKVALDFLASLCVLFVCFLFCIFALSWALLYFWVKLLGCCFSL